MPLKKKKDRLKPALFPIYLLAAENKWTALMLDKSCPIKKKPGLKPDPTSLRFQEASTTHQALFNFLDVSIFFQGVESFHFVIVPYHVIE